MRWTRSVLLSVCGDGYESIKESENGEEKKYIGFSKNEKGGRKGHLADRL